MLKREPIYHPDCIEIPLTRGRSAFVDLDCPPEILARNWYANPKGYAVAGRLYLHREILGLAPDDKREVDHDDGDPSNNRRSNLRPCTHQQNHANVRAHRRSTSRFRGVARAAHADKWRACLGGSVDGKRYSKHVGYFDDEIEAARAWDRAAVESGRYDPRFLQLNFPSSEIGADQSCR